MCGIIAVLANRPAAPLLLDALRRLEYRGYDSAGIATLESGKIFRLRTVGKTDALARALEAQPPSGSIGIGHTRWATHGAPSDANAHPHQVGPVAVVHNGIVENFAQLRDQLAADGVRFSSETDTEVIAHLCAREMARGRSPVDAVSATLGVLRGAFAVCFIFDGMENLLVCARRGSPLVIGYGDGEMFIGSDVIALAPLTHRIAYLDEGDMAAVTRDGAHIFDAAGMPVQRSIHLVAGAGVAVDKAGYRHFMLKEIHEQPIVAQNVISAYLSDDHATIISPVDQIDWNNQSRITMVACGTAFNATMVAKYWFEDIADLTVDVDIASEFRYRSHPMRPGGTAVFVSQSGETADTLAALRHAREAGQTTIAVVNVESSSIAREANIVIPIHAGSEIGVASTKAFVAQLAALAAMAVQIGKLRGASTSAEIATRIEALASLPRVLREALAVEPQLQAAAAELASARDVIYLGRGALYPIALEGALKFKELTYIHAEGYAAGELKHGPIALIDEVTPIVALALSGPLFDKTRSNLEEVKARKGRVVLVTDARGREAAGADMWRTIVMPEADPFIAPMVTAVAVQLLAYHAAVIKGTDVDQPRNLAKSVTVE